LQKIILKWLDNKVNYIGLKPKEDSNSKFQCKFSQLITYSRVNKEYLKPSLCYLIVNGESTKYNKIKRNNTFENFNLKINEYAITITSICFFIKKIFKKDKHEVEINNDIYLILDEVKQYFSIKNNYILDEEDKLDIFKNFFSKYHPNIISIEDIKNDKQIFNEFKQDLKNLSKFGCDKINNIGMFYPYKFDIDVFANNFYLLDLNPYKFLNKKLDLYQTVNNFYKRGINANIKTIMTLEKYFIFPNFSKYVAFFDPFQYKKVHSKNHKKLLEYITLKGFDKDEFNTNFLDFLNLLQYLSINMQYQELVYMITTYHYTDGLKDKHYTLKELLEKMLINVILSYNKKLAHTMQKMYDRLDKKNIRKKRITADDLGFKNDSSEKLQLMIF